MFHLESSPILSRIDERLTAIDAKLDALRMTAQNITDALQNAVTAINIVPQAVAALIQRLPEPTDPTAITLSAADAQTVVDGLTNIATATQAFVEQLNTILPQS